MVKRRRFGPVQRLEFMRKNLDLARAHVRVDRAVGTRAHEALHLEDEFGTDALGLREDLGPVGIEHNLQQALAIPEVDEDHAAMVTPTVNPAANLDFLADERLVDLAAIVSTHHENTGENPRKRTRNGTACRAGAQAGETT